MKTFGALGEDVTRFYTRFNDILELILAYSPHAPAYTEASQMEYFLKGLVEIKPFKIRSKTRGNRPKTL